MLSAFKNAARRLLIPTSATIELLSPCNLRCVHCYVTHSKKTVLKYPVVVDLLDQLAAAGTMTVTFTGGEIGLRKDLYDIIRAARERHFQVKLLSSGTRWTETDWNRIAELGVEAVRFSVYGSCAEVHESVTLSKGSFEQTLASALGLKARGIYVGFAVSVMHFNAHDIGNLIELGAKHDISVVVDPNITHTDVGNAGPAATRATFEQLVAMYGDTRVRALLHGEDSCSAPDPTLKPCGVGEKSVFIRSTGDVHPCSRWPIAGGNILDRPVLDIFRSGDSFNDARALRFETLSGCAGCGDASVCSQLAAMNLQENGRLGQPSIAVCETTAARSTSFYGQSKQQRSFRASLPIVI